MESAGIGDWQPADHYIFESHLWMVTEMRILIYLFLVDVIIEYNKSIIIREPRVSYCVRRG